MKPFLAIISPMKVGGGEGPGGGQPPRPDHTLPGQLPKPEHPIFFPLPPGAPVDPDYGVPEDGPHPDQGLPGDQPYPDQGLPGDQPHPDHGLPGPQPRPEHPIVLPPDSGGWLPVYIWGGGPHPDNTLPPIDLPPPETPPEDLGPIDWKPMWTAENGWQVIGVVEPPDMANVPTPSSRGRTQQPAPQAPRVQPPAQVRGAQPAPRGTRGATPTPAAKKPWPKRNR